MTLSCKACKRPMTLIYEVLERETVFVLWECHCGHKELERRPASARARAAGPVLVGAGASAGASLSAGEDD